MRALFVVTGFGFGDSIRSECIINEFIKGRKNKVLVLGYDFSYNYFRKKFKTLRMEGYNFPDYGLEFKTKNFILRNIDLPVKWIVSLRKNMEEIRNFNPDVVVSDFEPIANLISRRLNKKCVSVFGYDPEEFRKYKLKNDKVRIQAKYIETIYKNSDQVLIPSYKKKKNKDNIIYINPIARNIKNNKSKNVLKKLRLKKPPVLVMLGGSNYGIELARKIQKMSNDLDEEFVMFGGKRKINQKHFHGFNEKYLDYLSICKGIITLAGRLSLSEALKHKKPMLVFPIKNHVEQMLNAKAIKKYAYVANDNSVEMHVNKFIKNLSKYRKKVKNKIRFDGGKQAAHLLGRLK